MGPVMTEKRRTVLSRVTAVLVLAAALATLGLALWLGDAVLVRSASNAISRDAAGMLSTVGNAIRFYLVRAIALVGVLSAGNLVLCWKSRREPA